MKFIFSTFVHVCVGVSVFFQQQHGEGRPIILREIKAKHAPCTTPCKERLPYRGNLMKFATINYTFSCIFGTFKYHQQDTYFQEGRGEGIENHRTCLSSSSICNAQIEPSPWQSFLICRKKRIREGDFERKLRFILELSVREN